MIAGILALWRGFWGRCPVCGFGIMFRTFFGMNEGCAKCGRRYEGTGNQSTGAMGISLFVTLTLGFTGGVLLVIYLPNILAIALAIWLISLAIFQAVFYRLSRGLWIGILCITGAMDEDEHRDEFYL